MILKMLICLLNSCLAWLQTVNVLPCKFAERKEILCKKLKYKKIAIYMLEIRVNPLALIQKFLNTY